MVYSITCRNCGKKFTAVRSDAKFCGMPCRVFFSRKTEEKKQAVIEKIETVIAQPDRELFYDNPTFALEWVGVRNPANAGKSPMDMLKEAEPVFEKLIANARKIIRAGIGSDHVGFYKGWKLTLKGGQYGKKTSSYHQGTAVREEGSRTEKSD